MASTATHGSSTAQNADGLSGEFKSNIQPLLQKYCLGCHSTKLKKGSLDLERFTSVDLIRRDLKPWQQLIEQIEAREMPPKDHAQPKSEEIKKILSWTHDVLETEARAKSGDPGYVPLRRLSNAEYDYTIRDLTGVDLRPTREFPADGAAGEGFTNAAESLTDISPTLLNKYLNAAKDISERVVLLPEGFRFSPSKARRDWTDESTAALRGFYASVVPPDGSLDFAPYLRATIRYRDQILNQKISLAEVAVKEKLNARYLSKLWMTLVSKPKTMPLQEIAAEWFTATEQDANKLINDIASWQTKLWKTAAVGSYMRNTDSGYAVNLSRQHSNDPKVSETVLLKLAVKTSPGQSDVVINLIADSLSPEIPGDVVWEKPRFEGAGKPTLLLKDYPNYAAQFEVDYTTLFADTEKYLRAVHTLANDPKNNLEDVAQKNGLDAAFLKRWVEVLSLEPASKTAAVKSIPAVPLQLMTEKNPNNPEQPAIKGWHKKDSDLPVLVSNSSNVVAQIPGRVSAHGVSVHPLPREFVAVSWKCSQDSEYEVSGLVAHAHPTCGNGVSWWLEHRHGERAIVLGKGNLDLGKAIRLPLQMVKLLAGDSLVLAVDARDANHVCDLTEIDLKIQDRKQPTQKWILSADVADTVLQGNPHPDKYGHADAWSFVYGPSKVPSAKPVIPTDSILGQWVKAAGDPEAQKDLDSLANKVQRMLTGPLPKDTKDPNRQLYERLESGDSPLFKQVDILRLAKPAKSPKAYALAAKRFGKQKGNIELDDGSLLTANQEIISMTLPARLFEGREFVVGGRSLSKDSLVQLRVSANASGHLKVWDGSSRLLAAPSNANYHRLQEGYQEFRNLFPLFTCFPQVVPTDEVVSLKMFHREDEPLLRLFLSQEQRQQIDRLWEIHRFVSRQAIAENNYLPQFIGFVTQDQPKEMVAFFEGQRPAFQRRADELMKTREAAILSQMNSLMEFASRAFRRPLQNKEIQDLRVLYQKIRNKGADHEEAFRSVLSRILVSPAFLFRIEKASAGKSATKIDDWELATRLSYFLWSSAPDAELRSLAEKQSLRDPNVLVAQVQRMLKDERVRALAIEFGTQWIHVRGFDELSEKNEKLFPTFDANLKSAMYEEAILLFKDLFQNHRSNTQLLDADFTYLNEILAKHYGIPGVQGGNWRRVEGVRKYGRGGLLGLASVQTKQAGASRSSPVLRGNWVIETLLGEKLPRPLANVPKLPESEGDGGLTIRQQVEKHAKDASCAACHIRIDPFGFTMEKFDPIGRYREKDLAGLPIDTKATLKDGTRLDGIDGLRNYLLTEKKDIFVRLFCKRLLGYALGRSVALSDEQLLDEMVREMNRNQGDISTAIQVIVRSSQFGMIRGADYGD
ncbi:DUF1592 domain-containing protein [Telmatocola sphagniphila]|uniref:DUF1592 domain-containing protein n=1 Tax=Telmatocola sphagniphila TaxID=1123043 RepID=A0A8E6B8N3_9BACT|nr:DUF1592 domain-containing protein [Telmatocola sphagniphila]QVL33494.1 DUF1592 domain-containing protein [Telmatocola sphagniphila]